MLYFINMLECLCKKKKIDTVGDPLVARAAGQLAFRTRWPPTCGASEIGTTERRATTRRAGCNGTCKFGAIFPGAREFKGLAVEVDPGSPGV